MADTPKETGIYRDGDILYVGDILSVHSGYCGFMEVVDRENGFWLVDCTQKVLKRPVPENELNKDYKLDRDPGIEYRKVDPSDPFREPPFKIRCDQCEDTVVGTFDVETGEFAWFDTCGKHEEKKNAEDYGTEVTAICKLCLADPTRKPVKTELQQYFEEQYEKLPVKVTPGHWPVFNTREEVDDWIVKMKMFAESFDTYFSESEAEEDTE